MSLLRVTLKNYRCFTEENPATLEIRPGISALIGPNNAGKSSLIRFAHDLRPLFEKMSSSSFFSSMFAGSSGPYGARESLLADSAAFTDLNARPMVVQIQTESRHPHSAGLSEATSLELTLPRDEHAAPTLRLFAGGDEIPRDEFFDVSRSKQRSNTDISLDAVAEANACLRDAVFVGAFRNALDAKPRSTYFGCEVGTALVSRWKHLKNTPDRASNSLATRVTDDIRSVFDFRSLDINPSPEDDTLVVYTNGRSFALSELGSGIAQFIVILVNAAVRRPSMLFLDEPELSLHPSLQANLVTTLGHYARGTVVFATHSLGLARTVAERIFVVRMKPDGSSVVVPYEDRSSLPVVLGEMGFGHYRAIGFKTVLAVEGPTEIKAVQQLLRLLRKDHEVLVMPLGGSAMINGKRGHEMAELRRVSDRVFALIDSERSSESAPLERAREEFRTACQVASVHCHVLERRSFENYLSESAVRTVMGEKYRALGPYERLKDVTPSWAKEDNWRIVREMALKDLDRTDLLKFLSEL